MHAISKRWVRALLADPFKCRVHFKHLPRQKALHSITISLAPEFKRKLKIKHIRRSAVLSLYAVADNKDFGGRELCTHGWNEIIRKIMKKLYFFTFFSSTPRLDIMRTDGSVGWASSIMSSKLNRWRRRIWENMKVYSIILSAVKCDHKLSSVKSDLQLSWLPLLQPFFFFHPFPLQHYPFLTHGRPEDEVEEKHRR